MALFLQTQGNSAKFRGNFEYSLKIRENSGKCFSGHQFSDFLSDCWTKSWWILLYPRQDVKLPTVKWFRVATQYWKSKETWKSVEVRYGWWSTHFLLVKNSREKSIHLLLHSGKMTGLFECFELFCLNAEDTINTIIRYN